MKTRFPAGTSPWANQNLICMARKSGPSRKNPSTGIKHLSLQQEANRDIEAGRVRQGITKLEDAVLKAAEIGALDPGDNLVALRLIRAYLEHPTEGIEEEVTSRNVSAARYISLCLILTQAKRSITELLAKERGGTLSPIYNLALKGKTIAEIAADLEGLEMDILPAPASSKTDHFTILNNNAKAMRAGNEKEAVATLETAVLEAARKQSSDERDKMLAIRLIITYREVKSLQREIGRGDLTTTRHENLMLIMEQARAAADAVAGTESTLALSSQLGGITPAAFFDAVTKLEDLVIGIEPIPDPAPSEVKAPSIPKITTPPTPGRHPIPPYRPVPRKPIRPPAQKIEKEKPAPPPKAAEKKPAPAHKEPVAPTPAPTPPSAKPADAPQVVRNFRQPKAAPKVAKPKPEPEKPAEPVLDPALKARIAPLLARADGLRGRHKELIPVLLSARKIAPDYPEITTRLNDCAEELITQAEKSHRQGNHKGARTLLMRALSAEPTNPKQKTRMRTLAEGLRKKQIYVPGLTTAPTAKPAAPKAPPTPPPPPKPEPKPKAEEPTAPKPVAPPKPAGERAISARVLKRRATIARKDLERRKGALARMAEEKEAQGDLENAAAALRGLLKIDPDNATAQAKLAELKEKPAPAEAVKPRRTRDNTRHKPPKPPLPPKEVAAKRAAVIKYLRTGNNLSLSADRVLKDDPRIYWIIYDKRVFSGGIKEARAASREEI